MSQVPTGTVSLGDVNTALGLSSTATISLNDSSVRFLANQLSGTADMNTLRGKNYSNGTVTVGSYDTKDGPLYGFSANGFFMGSSTTSATFSVSQSTLTDLFTDPYFPNTYWGTANPNTDFPGSPTTLRIRVAGGTQYTYTYLGSFTYFYAWYAPGINIFGSGNVGGTYTWQAAY
jgi:hypothetical protein